MAISLKNKFTEKVEFTKYFGITGVKILTDTEGNPLINPTNEQLAEVFEDFKTEDKEEKVYVSKTKIGWGWTDLEEEGGKKRITQKEFDELTPMDREDQVVDEEVTSAKITFVVETLDNLRIRKLITFRFLDAPTITKKGDKVRVFNRYGKTTYVDAQGNYGSDKFEHTPEDLVKPLPLSTGGLGFDHLIDFLYAYSSLSRKVALLEEIDLDGIFDGDISSVEDLINTIHSDIVNDKGEPLYGAAVLFTVENNDSTNNEFRQSYYHKFERWIVNSKGGINKETTSIIKEIRRETKPAADGKVYSPASKGIFVGHNNLPKLGLQEFKPVYAKALMERSMASSPIASTPVGAAKGEDIFGGSNDTEFSFD